MFQNPNLIDVFESGVEPENFVVLHDTLPPDSKLRLENGPEERFNKNCDDSVYLSLYNGSLNEKWTNHYYAVVADAIV